MRADAVGKWIFWLVLTAVVCGTQSASSQITLPQLDTEEVVTIACDAGTSRWREEAYEVLWLRGPCEIKQGHRSIQGAGALLWIDHADDFSLAAHKIIAFVEDAKVTQLTDQQREPAAVVTSPTWLGNLQTHKPVFYALQQITPERPEPLPPIYRKAMQARTPVVQPLLPSAAWPEQTATGVQPAQFTESTNGAPAVPDAPIQPGQRSTIFPNAFASQLLGPTNPPLVSPAAPRRIRIFPRSNVRMNTDSFVSPDGTERVTLIDSGVNILIEGVGTLGTIDISTDRAVIWSPVGEASPGIGTGSGTGTALEFYLEGNIVFRQGNRVIYATSMYYDVEGENGVVLDAELMSDVPSYPGMVRLRAEVLRQLDRTRFQAHQAALTTSRLGIPRYWFQAGDVAFEDRQFPLADANGLPIIDPATGLPAVDQQRLATSRNNVIYLGEVPIFYWPFLQTDLTKPTTFINRVRFKNDRVFGTQIGVGFNVKQLLGITGNPGTNWSANIDYLSDRGWGFGTSYDYVLNRFLGIPGETRGFIDAWGIDEQGLDNLGRDRRMLVPEEDFRGRVLWQHRQRFANGWQATGELGLISDRNLLEQYYEREWDQWKDQITGLELKRLRENRSFNISIDGQLNEFFTQTEWLPRFDHFHLGESLLGDRLTWFSHSHVGYGKLEPATRPLDPVDLSKFNPLAWEDDTEGIRAGGRYEIDLPLQAGPVRVVPFGLGEVVHWGETLDGSERTRLLGQAGVRASLPMWTVDPTCENVLFNVNGLAHKVVWETEFLWADADQNLADLPLYDPLDDDSQEHFRRRFVDDTFGGTLFVDDLVPLRFDERFYALRSGLQSWVTAPAEIADDLMLLRAGVRQRWQTKRGVPGFERIVDWMTLDIEGTLFPKANRDNFGADVGMLIYDWRWHVGDRLTLMSDGYADTFGDGLRMFTVGSYISRPERGSAYLGFRSIEGPISSNVLNTAVSYRMTHKWLASAGAVVDFGQAGNIGQIFELTRIGESFLISLNANYDASRDNLGVGVAIEPRFLSLSYRGRVGGTAIPPAYAYGLE